MTLRTLVADRLKKRASPPASLVGDASSPGLFAGPSVEADDPICGELFGTERMEQFARELAAAHRVVAARRLDFILRRRPLLARLEDNARVLRDCYRSISSELREERPISPAAEWLVDNFHLVEDQLRAIREDLPPAYYHQLPLLAEGRHRGLPRVYAVVWGFVEHTDSRLDLELLRTLIGAYQSVQPLTLGELWAVAISIRILLVENLRRLSERMVRRQATRKAADELADDLLAMRSVSGPTRAKLTEVEHETLPTSFVVRLVERLRDQDPATIPGLEWLNRYLAMQETASEEVVRIEHHKQAASLVSVRNVITSMRALAGVDWNDFFDSVSLVEQALRDGTHFAEMDFSTRDRYRHAVEDLARGSEASELEIARRAAERARGGRASSERLADPGYWLISAGRREFELELGYRPGLRERVRRTYLAAATAGYLSAIVLVTGLLLALPVALQVEAGVPARWLVAFALLASFPASTAAIALVNRHVTWVLRPARLPKLSLDGGIPEGLRTLVVMPTLLTNSEVVRELVSRLEVHYLANPDPGLCFALLSDWVDADKEHLPDDEPLLALALEAVLDLNRRHGPLPDGGARFLLLHRRRRWNPSEGCWMGWERKRGKLRELNRLLRGAQDTSFLPRADRSSRVPAEVRYVITLDADTRVPLGVARKLVAAMSHALNRPVFDGKTERVVEGYAVLQPRITATLPVEDPGTPFQRIFAGPLGTDPYAFAVSDVYQDLFGTGIYTGKGIYDVDGFERALRGRVPENALLSHDLFEGLYARAGLLSDVELFEDYPSHYGLAAARQERWARGDWQLLPWLLPRVPVEGGGRAPNPLTAIGRFQIFDNLRRSLAAPASCLLALASWTLPAASPWVWPAFLAVTTALPAFLPLPASLIPRRRGIGKRSFLRAAGGQLGLAAAQAALSLAFLAHQTWLMSEAIARTLWRLYVSRRRLLQWVSAAVARAEFDLGVASIHRRMAPALVLAGAALGLTSALKIRALPAALPWAALWALSPTIARWISLPPRTKENRPLSVEQVRLLRSTARRTWRFFEVYIGAADHHLPPDNYQEDPRPVLARRTSPTNIGLYLLATVSARDLGWIGTIEMVERLEATLATLQEMERHGGHLYNWYSTSSLQPLVPRYVSTVDSGNLAGHLIALRQACLATLRSPVFSERAVARIGEGIRDAVVIARETLDAAFKDRRARTHFYQRLEQQLENLDGMLGARPRTAQEMTALLGALSEESGRMLDLAQALLHERGDLASAEVVAWCKGVNVSVSSQLRDFQALADWTRSLPSSPTYGMLGLEELHRELEAASAALEGSSADNPREREHPLAISALCRRLAILARSAGELVDGMDFRFLYDPAQRLFALGYRVEDGSLDGGRYDLLASEARLASFVAVAHGEVPPKHWFRLGRRLMPLGRGLALVSWSGSMFEYLMPDLVLRTPAHSLLDQTRRLIVREQIRYAERRGVPWGISESAFSGRDFEHTYQYKSFGVSGLGLKKGLGLELVIAPYATALGAMVDACAAAKNFERLTSEGALGRFGFYEALDYTGERLLPREKRTIVRAYMAHHQGMTIVALTNVLTSGGMRAFFHAEPAVQAAELLLQERTPHGVAVTRPLEKEEGPQPHIREVALTPVQRRFRSPHDPIPRTHLLSNGRYAVMVTSAGSGYSRWQDLAVTRWREDVTRDCWGTYVFLGDVQRGGIWSAGYQPSGTEPDSYEALFAEDRVEIRRRDGTLTSALHILVSPEDDAEIRLVSVTNLGLFAREIEFTSYAEIALAPPASDAAHPAFSKLFLQTEFVPGLEALLATRRPRSAEEPRIWAAHVLAVEGETVGALQYETDRARFLGRGRNLRNASCITDRRPLSDTVGPVLDPVFSLRRRVRIPPGGTASVAFTTLIASTRDAALALADKYRQAAILERTATLAATQAQVQLRHLGIDADEAHLFQRLANSVLYSDPALRPPAEVLRANQRGPSGLWQHGISGDLPIVVARVEQAEDRELARQLLRAHEYWRMKGLAVDLVLLNAEPQSYDQNLQVVLESFLRTRQPSATAGARPPSGGIFLVRAERLVKQDRNLLLGAARAVLDARRGLLSDQFVLEGRQAEARAPSPPPAPEPPPQEVPPARIELEFFNGLGGFDRDGREYVVVLGERRWTPAPWINVIANARFGFQVSEAGAGFTWSENSRENQLTPWSNDPVGDQPGEALYVRDDETGELWGPTALPIREDLPYLARHGQGWSRFAHESHGIALELLQFVAREDPVKLSRLSLENRSTRQRKLSVTAYLEWVLGRARESSAPRLITWRDPLTEALLARNPWNEEFRDRVAFAALGGPTHAWTCDRTEFLGRNGTLERPAALARGASLAGRAGAALDPCAVLQQSIALPAGARAEIVVLVGQASSEEEALALVLRYRQEDPEASLRAATERWEDILGTLQVKTPDRALDFLVNRWLLYQTLSARVWARAGFYQASGAFGFRDQLQDVLALTVARRDLARKHVLLCASRQFREGDVQHWWHEPSGRGVRTRISDNRLWLPYAVLHYCEVTGDRAILDELVPFLEGPPLAPRETESYFIPAVSEERSSLFEHCARALERSLELGPHGLPLMGTGDWNDGMNRVGLRGRGESVWLGWFLHLALRGFAELAEERGEHERARGWRERAHALQAAIEREAWDGDWYRRAFFDDGTPLGAAADLECRIDSIAQSWGVISGAADPAHAARAMAAVEEYLVKRADGLIALFTPPFDRTPLDPGYIKGYPPGVRENGGQYTHAAVWAVIAFAELGQGDKASELFALLNPILPSSTRAGMYRYKVEPYVMAADVYSELPHVGRGGWTWYTGSAGWMYRAAVEWLLGFRLRGSSLYLDPCISRSWPSYEIAFRYHAARYELRVENPRGVARGVAQIELDGIELPAGQREVPLSPDQGIHRIRVVLG